MAKSKLDSIEILVFQALIDMEISHEKFNPIIREKKNMTGWNKYEKSQWKRKNIRSNSVNSKDQRVCE